MTRAKRPKHAVTIETKVAFHECDPLGVAWHGRYFEWMELARTELFASFDLDVPQIRELGARMYVVETKCRYMVPLVYGDPVQVTAWVSAGAPLIKVAYDIYNGANQRWSARATTLLATTDHAGKLLPRTPDALLERLPHR